ncbi:phage portal protein [Methylobacterium nigriterrae]|uniref:phage portal protein n=1 Tax=Methylobacterium nigriterrae TaxID=3127512 RepID=UPI0030138ED5
MAGKRKQRKAEARARRNTARATFAPGLGYEGARTSRRLRGWLAERVTINALQARGGDVLRARARQLVRDNAYAASAVDTFVGSAVGDGITPSPVLSDLGLKAAIKEAWLRWTDEADADGLTDFYGLQALAARSMFVAGECFIRFRPRRASDGFSVPLQLQLIESEQLPLSYNVERSIVGNEIRHGIEFDAIGRRVAYHFLRRRPGEGELAFGYSPTDITVVPASEVMHLYRPLEAGQIRGQSQLTPAMVRLYLLDSYDDAELDRKRVAAMFAGFITKNAIGDPLPVPSRGDAFGLTEDPASNEPEIETTLADLEPGTLQVLNPGEDIRFSNPTEVGGSYEAFQFRNLLAIAAACGVPYAALTGDASKGNFSSQRSIELEFKRRVSQFQHQTLVFQLCRPVWARWIATAALAGSVPGLTPTVFNRDKRALSTVRWMPPKWDWVDPLKDLRADELAIKMGIMPRSDAIEARGGDAEEIDTRRKEDQDRADGFGLRLDGGTVDDPNPVPGADAADAA